MSGLHQLIVVWTKTQSTEGHISLGHFWYRDDWVPNPPTPDPVQAQACARVWGGVFVTAEPQGAYGTTDEAFLVLTCACLL